MGIWSPLDLMNIVRKFSILTCLFKETHNSVKFQKIVLINQLWEQSIQAFGLELFKIVQYGAQQKIVPNIYHCHFWLLTFAHFKKTHMEDSRNNVCYILWLVMVKCFILRPWRGDFSKHCHYFCLLKVSYHFTKFQVYVYIVRFWSNLGQIASFWDQKSVLFKVSRIAASIVHFCNFVQLQCFISIRNLKKPHKLDSEN